MQRKTQCGVVAVHSS